MGIRKIDLNLCNGCGMCIDACPMDVLRIDEVTKKPFIKYLRDCQSCFLCEMNEENYWETGANIEKMFVGSWDIDKLTKFLYEGE